MSRIACIAVLLAAIYFDSAISAQNATVQPLAGKTLSFDVKITDIKTAEK